MDDIMKIFKQGQDHILAVQDEVQKAALQLDEKVGMPFDQYLDELAKEFGFKESK